MLIFVSFCLVQSFKCRIFFDKDINNMGLVLAKRVQTYPQTLDRRKSSIHVKIKNIKPQILEQYTMCGRSSTTFNVNP